MQNALAMSGGGGGLRTKQSHAVHTLVMLAVRTESFSSVINRFASANACTELMPRQGPGLRGVRCGLGHVGTEPMCATRADIGVRVGAHVHPLSASQNVRFADGEPNAADDTCK